MNHTEIYNINQLDLINTMPEILIVVLALIVIRIVYTAKLFEKAGEEWWYYKTSYIQ